MKSEPVSGASHLGVYIHIPFCRTRCPYCDFLRIPIAGDVPLPFIDALCTEIAAYDGPADADTVFFGGGTPSLLAPAALERVLNAVRARFVMRTPEISVEANPDDVSPALLDAWLALGVNRLSLGVQSFDERVLRYLGRRHDARRARDACAWAAERFRNWSIDLIFGAKPVEAWPDTLDACTALAPPHVSAYGLTFEPETPFKERVADVVDDQTYLALYWLADERLPRLTRYEISNLAAPGFECRHNLRYWRNENYAGFGPGAYSFLGGVRSRNASDIAAYCAGGPLAKEEALVLSAAEIRTETLIQCLRLRAGLSKPDYRRRFGTDVRADFANALDALIERELIVEGPDAVRPTRLGFELNNEIGLALVPPST